MTEGSRGLWRNHATRALRRIPWIEMNSWEELYVKGSEKEGGAKQGCSKIEIIENRYETLELLVYNRCTNEGHRRSQTMSTDATNSSKKFEEALQLLNEAAKDKKDEIQGLLGDKYTHIKDAIEEMASDKAKEFKRLKKTALAAFDEGGEKFKEVAEDLDEKVHEDPWLYIGGAALGALLLGFILGSSKRS